MNILDNLLATEAAYPFWQPEVSAVKLWPGIRFEVLITPIVRPSGFVQPPKKQSAVWYHRHLWKEHLRTLSFLATPVRKKHPILFFISGSDRVYHFFYTRTPEPLIVEAGWYGRVSQDLRNSGAQVVLEDTLTLSAYVASKPLHLSKEAVHEIDDFALFVMQHYDLADSRARLTKQLITYVKRHLSLSPLIKRLILPRFEGQLVFIRTASYMGNAAPLVKLMHDQGCLVAEAQHGSANEHHAAYNYPPDSLSNPQHPSRQYLPDIFLSHGQYWSDRMRSPSRQVIVGFPHLSRMVEDATGNRQSNAKQILIVSGLISHLAEITAELAKALPDYQIIYKLHPTETQLMPTWESLTHLPNVEVKGIVNIHELIAESAIIVGYNSTVMWETLCFPGKRIFVLDNEFVPDGVGEKFSSAEQLIAYIRDPQRGYSTAPADYFWASDWESRIDRFLSEYIPV